MVSKAKLIMIRHAYFEGRFVLSTLLNINHQNRNTLLKKLVLATVVVVSTLLNIDHQNRNTLLKKLVLATVVKSNTHIRDHL